MKNFLKYSILILFLQGCGPRASIVSTGFTIAQSGSTTRAVAASGSGLFVKQKTGKQPLEHVADSAFNAELRKCNVNHSAEINEIFFTTFFYSNLSLFKSLKMCYNYMFFKLLMGYK